MTTEPPKTTAVTGQTGGQGETNGTASGCLCVDRGPSTQGQLTFTEAGQGYVQEQIFIEETGILGEQAST